MPAGFPIPPWLTTRPAEHAEASQAGMRQGLAAAQIWAQAAQERARLEQSARQHDIEAEMERQRIQEKSIYEAQKLAADVAYNKASLSQADDRIAQTQSNAARMAQQWESNNKLAQQRADQIDQIRNDRLNLSERRATETARHNQAMENRTKGVSEDAALAAYAKSRQTPESGGFLDRIKNFFTGDQGAPSQKIGGSPYADGDYVTNKKDGKTYRIQNGLPVLVDDKSGESESETPSEPSE